MTDLITTEPGTIQYKSTLDGEIKRFTFSDIPPEFVIEIPEDAVYILDWGFATDGKARLISCPSTLIEVPETPPNYVTNMYGFFSGCKSLVGANLPKWDVSHVNSMPYMFNEASSFNQDISGWDVSNVKEMDAMFNVASSFNQDLSSWNVTSITEEPKAFSYGADSWVFSKPVWGTNGGKVDPIEGKIQYVSRDSTVELVDIIEGETTIPTTYRVLDWGYLSDIKEGVDYSIILPNNIEIVPNKEPSYITNMDSMFEGCDKFVGMELKTWNTSRITSMKATFKGTKSLNVDLSNWDVSNVTTMEEMFMNSAIIQ